MRETIFSTLAFPESSIVVCMYRMYVRMYVCMHACVLVCCIYVSVCMYLLTGEIQYSIHHLILSESNILTQLPIN